MRESPVSQRTQDECGNVGILIQRNNNGACVDNTGRVVRYGLMNESKKQNEEMKSSDLIGCARVIITPEMVGQTIGVYCAFETKKTGWHLTPGDAHGQAQAAYHRLVNAYGGRAGFVSDPVQVRQIMQGLLK